VSNDLTSLTSRDDKGHVVFFWLSVSRSVSMSFVPLGLFVLDQFAVQCLVYMLLEFFRRGGI